MMKRPAPSIVIDWNVVCGGCVCVVVVVVVVVVVDVLLVDVQNNENWRMVSFLWMGVMRNAKCENAKMRLLMRSLRSDSTG